MRPPVLVLHAPGSNRDREAAWALQLAGAAPTIAPIRQWLEGGLRLGDYRMLVLPGGFSYGDDLGAGRVWAAWLTGPGAEALAGFVDSGRPVLGICNGFQTLVKAGVLPGGAGFTPRATLTRNLSARFECRWVRLQPNPAAPCVFTQGLGEPIACPVAHGEGRLVAADEATAAELQRLAALRYLGPTGPDGEVLYPHNPNGSVGAVAGICNPAGNVLGLMPHPEDHILPRQHPQAHRGPQGELGLPLFVNGVRYAANL